MPQIFNITGCNVYNVSAEPGSKVVIMGGKTPMVKPASKAENSRPLQIPQVSSAPIQPSEPARKKPAPSEKSTKKPAAKEPRDYGLVRVVCVADSHSRRLSRYVHSNQLFSRAYPGKSILHVMAMAESLKKENFGSEMKPSDFVLFPCVNSLRDKFATNKGLPAVVIENVIDQHLVLLDFILEKFPTIETVRVVPLACEKLGSDNVKAFNERLTNIGLEFKNNKVQFAQFGGDLSLADGVHFTPSVYRKIWQWASEKPETEKKD